MKITKIKSIKSIKKPQNFYSNVMKEIHTPKSRPSGLQSKKLMAVKDSTYLN